VKKRIKASVREPSEMLKELSKLSRFRYIDKIQITMYNPNTVTGTSLFRPAVWCAEVTFKKNNSVLYTSVESNDTEDFIKKIYSVVETEQKI
jgi:hypothetical protein